MREFLHTGLVSNWMGNNRLQQYSQSQWDAGISNTGLVSNCVLDEKSQFLKCGDIRNKQVWSDSC